MSKKLSLTSCDRMGLDLQLIVGETILHFHKKRSTCLWIKNEITSFSEKRDSLDYSGFEHIVDQFDEHLKDLLKTFSNKYNNVMYYATLFIMSDKRIDKTYGDTEFEFEISAMNKPTFTFKTS